MQSYSDKTQKFDSIDSSTKKIKFEQILKKLKKKMMAKHSLCNHSR